MSKPVLSWEEETILHANAGSETAGREALALIADRIDRRQFDSPLFDYAKLRLFLNEGLPLSKALRVEPGAKKVGRRRKLMKPRLWPIFFLATTGL